MTSGQFKDRMKPAMQKWRSAAAVLSWGMISAACGVGGEPALGTYTSGIVSTQAGPACVSPAPGPGWTDAALALASGATGDPCLFSGGRGEGSFDEPGGAQLVTCVGHQLVVQRASYAGELVLQDDKYVDPMCPDGAQPAEVPAVHDGECLRHCGGSSYGGWRSVLTCVVGTGQPTRTLDVPLTLSSDADCETLFSACPQVGDPCVGEAICRSIWFPIRGSSTGGVGASAWCANGSLRIASTF
jgi:hypothetical protein